MFISFEGIDSSGKTTQIALLEQWLRKKNREYLVVREPGGTKISEKIRDILLDPIHHEMNPVSELLLFSAARAQLTQQIIIPALKKDTIVICDRYFDSTTAYQGYGREIDLETIQQIHLLVTQNTRPDITFFIDIPFEESINRKGKMKDEADRMERSSIEFYNKVRNGYLKIASEESDRIIVLNGMMNIESLHHIIIQSIQEKNPSFIKK